MLKNSNLWINVDWKIELDLLSTILYLRNKRDSMRYDSL